MFNSKVFALLPQLVCILEGQALPNRDLKVFESIAKMDYQEALLEIHKQFRQESQPLKILTRQDSEMGGLEWDITIRYSSASGFDHMRLHVFEEVDLNGFVEKGAWLYSLKATSERGGEDEPALVFELEVVKTLKVEIGADYHLTGFGDEEELLAFLDALKPLFDNYVEEFELVAKAIAISKG